MIKIYELLNLETRRIIYVMLGMNPILNESLGWRQMTFSADIAD